MLVLPFICCCCPFACLRLVAFLVLLLLLPNGHYVGMLFVRLLALAANEFTVLLANISNAVRPLQKKTRQQWIWIAKNKYPLYDLKTNTGLSKDRKKRKKKQSNVYLIYRGTKFGSPRLWCNMLQSPQSKWPPPNNHQVRLRFFRCVWSLRVGVRWHANCQDAPKPLNRILPWPAPPKTPSYPACFPRKMRRKSTLIVCGGCGKIKTQK